MAPLPGFGGSATDVLDQHGHAHLSLFLRRDGVTQTRILGDGIGIGLGGARNLPSCHGNAFGFLFGKTQGTLEVLLKLHRMLPSRYLRLHDGGRYAIEAFVEGERIFFVIIPGCERCEPKLGNLPRNSLCQLPLC